jgi:ATP-dependent DNA helicase PIF1
VGGYHFLEGRVILVHILRKGVTLPSKVEIHPLFPLEHIMAITVHKSQGRTLDQVKLTLAHIRGMLHDASVYVALIRVRKKEGIHLLLTRKICHREVDAYLLNKLEVG